MTIYRQIVVTVSQSWYICKTRNE